MAKVMRRALLGRQGAMAGKAASGPQPSFIMPPSGVRIGNRAHDRIVHPASSR